MDPILVRSPVFEQNGSIPIEFTADGDNVPPLLSWDGVPENAKSIAIICEDPDAPKRTFTHWIVVGIPASTKTLDPSAPPATMRHGKNDHGSLGWYGPNPPSGRHHYVFKVFALDIELDKEGMSKPELYAAIKGHILARGELIGTYEKGRPRALSAHR